MRVIKPIQLSFPELRLLTPLFCDGIWRTFFELFQHYAPLDVIMDMLIFISPSFIQTKIKEMDHSNIFYLEMELELFLLLMKKQVIFMPQEELIGRKRPFILSVRKRLTEELCGQWSQSLNLWLKSTISMTMNQHFQKKFTLLAFLKCLL